MTRDEKTAVLGVSAIVAIGCVLWLVGQAITQTSARHVAEPPTAHSAGNGSQATRPGSTGAEGGEQ